MLSVLAGLLAGFGWGTGDFFLALASRRAGVPRTTAVTQTVSFALWVGLWFLLPKPELADFRAWWQLVAAAGSFVAGMWLFQRALTIGSVAVVAPVTAGYPIITGIIEIAAGARPQAAVLGGAFLLVLGVVVVSQSPSGGEQTKPGAAGLMESIVAAFLFGLMFWCLAQLTSPEALGSALPMLALKGTAVLAALAALALRKPEPLPALERPLFVRDVAVFGSLDVFAWLGFIAAAQLELAVVTTALAALSSTVTVLFGAMVLKEKLTPAQWAGVGIILLGIAVVAWT